MRCKAKHLRPLWWANILLRVSWPQRLLQMANAAFFLPRQIPRLPRAAIQNKIRFQSIFRIVKVNLVRAIYTGSFDPLTNGHLDLIERGSKIFDELIVSILRNSEKDPLFTLAERREMLEEMVRRYENVRVDTFEGLLVDYAMQQKAKAVLRGIRAISDYEYELQMALMNRKLQPQLETIFMMPAEAYSYLSSRLVKEIFRLGGSVRGLVPELVEQRLREKFHGTAATI
jgi:pantetheine-phosphate adenylyltransferase